MVMKIFLTGINGFLGRHVALKLNYAGHEVLGLVRSDVRKDCLSGLPIEYCEGDLLDADSYKTQVETCDAVIHTAAITSFHIYDESNAYLINTEGTKKLLQISVDSGIKRFIYISTRGTLGVSHNPENSSEQDGYKEKNKMDTYFITKYLAEKEVIKYSTQKNIFSLVLSPTAMIGKYDDKPSPVGQILLSYLKGKIKVYMDGGINIVDVEDVALASVRALTKGKNGEVYIIGNKNMSLYNLFEKIASIHSVKLPKIKLPYFIAYSVAFIIEKCARIIGRSPFTTRNKVFSLYNNHSFCSSEKAINELGIKNVPISKTLDNTVNWFCSYYDIYK